MPCTHIWRLEDSLQDSVLPIYHTGPWNTRAQAWLCKKYLNPLGHLAGPSMDILGGKLKIQTKTMRWVRERKSWEGCLIICIHLHTFAFRVQTPWFSRIFHSCKNPGGIRRRTGIKPRLAIWSCGAGWETEGCQSCKGQLTCLWAEAVGFRAVSGTVGAELRSGCSRPCGFTESWAPRSNHRTTRTGGR